MKSSSEAKLLTIVNCVAVIVYGWHGDAENANVAAVIALSFLAVGMICSSIESK